MKEPMALVDPTAADADFFWILQVDLMRNISGIPQPFLYTRHVHFLNFTR